MTTVKQKVKKGLHRKNNNKLKTLVKLMHLTKINNIKQNIIKALTNWLNS